MQENTVEVVASNCLQKTCVTVSELKIDTGFQEKECFKVIFWRLVGA